MSWFSWDKLNAWSGSYAGIFEGPDPIFSSNKPLKIKIWASLKTNITSNYSLTSRRKVMLKRNVSIKCEQIESDL